MAGSGPIRVYLDTNVYCRPFDDQSDETIRADTGHVLALMQLLEQGRIEAIASGLLIREAGQLKDRRKRQGSLTGMTRCRHQVQTRPSALQNAGVIAREAGLESLDALHIALAAEGGASHFVTCDRDIIRKASRVARTLARLAQPVLIVGPEALRTMLE